MMQATFVRLDDADLAVMAKRLNSVLTDDGAHAWYKHDVAELLQELVAMRQERAHAIQSFREHDALTGVPDSLPLIAAAWRESVTGLWEKAQVKKLRAETAQARQERDEMSDLLVKANNTILDLEEKSAGLQAQLETAVQAHERRIADQRAERETLTARIQELESQVSALQDEQATEQQRVAAMVKTVETAYAERAARANQLLAEAGGILGA